MEVGENNFVFLGWNKSEGHDKIYGLVETSQGVFTFWGRRKGSLSFKQYSSLYEAEEVAYKKQKKGYARCNTEVLPEDFVGQLMMACLGRVKFGLDN